MRALKITAGIFLVILVAFAAFVVRTLYKAGSFTPVESRFAGRCVRIPGPVGPEDLTIDPATGRTLVSASDRRATLAGRSVPGALWAFDLDTPGARPVNLTPTATVEFQPHGISLWTGADGRRSLFVINHAPVPGGGVRYSVQLFDIDGNRATLRSTFESPLLVMPNDIVAVGPDRFYLTNTHLNPPGPWQTIETFLQLTGAQVLFFDGEKFRVALDDFPMPNGINVSPDGRTLWVASVTTRQVRVYDRDPAEERLTLRQRIDVGGGPDNLEVAADGSVWVAAHPQLLRIAQHLKNPAERSPSAVFRIGIDGQANEVYSNTGEEISAASTAAVFGKHMLLGQIFDDGILDCTLP